MEKISVKICNGTTCFIMGGANLYKLNYIMPEDYKDKVELSAVNCLGLCSTDWDYSKAPYVMVGEEIVPEATPEKVLEVIERHLANK